MNEEMQKELFTRIDALAAKLGVAAGRLWEVLVTQAVVEAWIALTFMAITGGTCVAAIVTLRYLCVKHKDIFSGDVGGAVAGVAIVSGALFVVTIVFGTQYVLTGFINPEYAAFQDVARILK